MWCFQRCKLIPWDFCSKVRTVQFTTQYITSLRSLLFVCSSWRLIKSYLAHPSWNLYCNVTCIFTIIEYYGADTVHYITLFCKMQACPVHNQVVPPISVLLPLGGRVCVCGWGGVVFVTFLSKLQRPVPCHQGFQTCNISDITPTSV